jgi:hypothetical protein
MAGRELGLAQLYDPTPLKVGFFKLKQNLIFELVVLVFNFNIKMQIFPSSITFCMTPVIPILSSTVLMAPVYKLFPQKRRQRYLDDLSRKLPCQLANHLQTLHLLSRRLTRPQRILTMCRSASR